MFAINILMLTIGKSVFVGESDQEAGQTDLGQLGKSFFVT